MELYIHIPYCRQKCRYCDFASYPGQEGTMARYVDALLAESAALRDAEYDGKPISTVFLGGGTPSLLPAPLMEKLLKGLHQQYAFAPDAEFTSEANPGTLTPSWLKAAADGGVNRISMGLQAYQPELLRTLGRIHTFQDVTESVQMCRDAGLTEISLDLMFGLPGQTEEMWRETLDAALSLHPVHLSCYGLIPEEGTPLMRDLDAGRLTLPDEEAERRMYDDALRILAQHGFAQYEISNFALPGHACRHNIGYWQHVPYLGLGASAAGMYLREGGCLRTANPLSIPDYIAMVEQGDYARRELTPVSREEMRFESLMLGLRMTQGVSEGAFAKLHGMTLDAYRGQRLESLRQRDLLSHEDGCWRLTRRGMDVQNAVLVELMDE